MLELETLERFAKITLFSYSPVLFTFSGECMGMLGKNGAGKTSVLRMLIGDEPITKGEAYIAGISIRRDLLKTYKFFGYCPQHEAVLDDLTAEDWLEIICLIRGVPLGHIKTMAMQLAQGLGFQMHLKKKVSNISGGHKRKLSVALALIGEPAVVYMDEPTSGMDPTAKRCVWNALSSYRELGNSIVLSSHSMDECQALCTRMIILLEGKMMAIATSYQLKQKYSKTGHLVILMTKEYAGDVGNLNRLKSVLTMTLTDFEVKEEYHGKLECDFNATEKLSKLYGLMQSLKKDYHIAEYAVSNQNSLINVFLDQVSSKF